MRATFFVLLGLATACDVRRMPPVARLSAPELAAIYEAVLTDTSDGRRPSSNDDALELVLMSDSATFEASGHLSDSVAHALLARGVIVEFCRPLDSSKVAPTCVARHARASRQFSRVLELGPDTVRVFVAGDLTYPYRRNKLPLGGGVERVTVARRGDRWAVVRREWVVVS